MPQDARHPNHTRRGSPNSNIAVPQPVHPAFTSALTEDLSRRPPEHRQQTQPPSSRRSASPRNSAPRAQLPRWGPAQVIWRLENGRIVYETNDPPVGRAPAPNHNGNRNTPRRSQESQPVPPTNTPNLTDPQYPVTPYPSAEPELVESDEDDEEDDNDDDVEGILTCTANYR
jgi:hypothetical protein